MSEKKNSQSSSGADTRASDPYDGNKTNPQAYIPVSDIDDGNKTNPQAHMPVVIKDPGIGKSTFDSPQQYHAPIVSDTHQAGSQSYITLPPEGHSEGHSPKKPGGRP
jgi:hypothetical protein